MTTRLPTNLDPTFLGMLRAARDGFDDDMREARLEVSLARAAVLKRVKPIIDRRKRLILADARKKALQRERDGVAAAKEWLRENRPELVPKPKPRAPSLPPSSPIAPISPAPIETQEMKLSNPGHPDVPSKLLSKPALGRGSNEEVRAIVNKRASILHLVDLKRAGHSPTKTELRIPSDDSALHRLPPSGASMSLYSSSANMCAEL